MEYEIITHVGKNLYRGDAIETRPSQSPIVPTLIQDFAGRVTCIFRGEDGKLTKETYESEKNAMAFIAERFGVHSPVVKFIKGVVVNGNGQIIKDESDKS